MFGDLICASPAEGASFDSMDIRRRLNTAACDEFKSLMYLMAGDDEDRTLIGPPPLIKATLAKLKKQKGVAIKGHHIGE